MHDSLLGYITNIGRMQLTCLRVKMYVFPESYILVHSVKTSLFNNLLRLILKDEFSRDNINIRSIVK